MLQNCIALLIGRMETALAESRTPLLCVSRDAHGAIQSLKQHGVALMAIGVENRRSFQRAFRVGVAALDAIKSSAEGLDRHRCSVLNMGTGDALDASGFHGFGALSKYNAHREGFIFSNKTIYNPFDEKHELFGAFAESMQFVRDAAMRVAASVLDAVADDLGSSESFERRYGPLGPSLQWHLKRYAGEGGTLLGVHTDPSLVSVVIIDREGIQEGAAGLEWYDPVGKCWCEVAHSGHGVAIILAGSILEKVSSRAYKACRHRVVSTRAANARVAQTFFVRPSPDAPLVPVADVDRGGRKKKSYQTFRQWKSRVSKRYERGNPK